MYKFRVNILPPSSNKMYAINHYNRSVYMSEEVRHFKMALKLACPVMKFSCPEPRLSIEIAYYSPKWICKNSKIRKADGMNLDKAVYDAISEKIGIDDSHFFKWAGIKVLSQEEYTEIQVTEIESES